MTKSRKRYWEMTSEELSDATKEFDQEHIGVSFRAMTPAEEKAWRVAVKKRGRSGARVSNGVTTLSVEIDTALLKRVDALAKKRGLSRARLVAESLESLLTKKGA